MKLIQKGRLMDVGQITLIYVQIIQLLIFALLPQKIVSVENPLVRGKSNIIN